MKELLKGNTIEVFNTIHENYYSDELIDCIFDFFDKVGSKARTQALEFIVTTTLSKIDKEALDDSEEDTLNFVTDLIGYDDVVKASYLFSVSKGIDSELCNYLVEELIMSGTIDFNGEE